MTNAKAVGETGEHADTLAVLQAGGGEAGIAWRLTVDRRTAGCRDDDFGRTDGPGAGPAVGDRVVAVGQRTKNAQRVVAGIGQIVDTEAVGEAGEGADALAVLQAGGGEAGIAWRLTVARGTAGCGDDDLSRIDGPGTGAEIGDRIVAIGQRAENAQRVAAGIGLAVDAEAVGETREHRHRLAVLEAGRCQARIGGR